MKKMTVKEVIDKLANTKIYTRGRGVEMINKIYPLLSKLEFKVEEYDIFPFFELIKEEGDSSMLRLKSYYSMHVFSTCEFKEITPEEILDIEFNDKEEDNPDFEKIEMPFRVGDKVSFLLNNRVHEDVVRNVNIEIRFLSDGKRDIKYWFITDIGNFLKGDLFHTTEELLNDLKNKITR